MSSRRGTFADFVVDQLGDLGAVESRAMFGGLGLYSRHTFFGIVFKERLYFLTDKSSRAAYVAKGMRPFQPRARQTLGNYFEVPADIVEDRYQLALWARTAIATRKATAGARKPVAG